MSTTSLTVAIAVVEHHGRFLIGQRPPGVPLAGCWEFPGGKVLADECLESAAVRECREETGLAVRVTDTIMSRVHEYAHGLVELHFFRCRLDDASNNPQPPFIWVPRSELPQYQFPAGNAALLELLQR